MKFSEKLKELNACQEFVKWVDDKTEQEAWEECERADWLMWYVFRAKIGTEKDRILAVCAFARMAIRYVKGEDRPLLAIEAAERYAQDPTKENRKSVVAAQQAAWLVARSPAREATRIAYFADGAARAAHFAAETTWATGAACFAAEVANWEAAVRGVASKASWEENREAAHREMCCIIREKIKLKGGDHSDPA